MSCHLEIDQAESVCCFSFRFWAHGHRRTESTLILAECCLLLLLNSMTWTFKTLCTARPRKLMALFKSLFWYLSDFLFDFRYLLKWAGQVVLWFSGRKNKMELLSKYTWPPEQPSHFDPWSPLQVTHLTLLRLCYPLTFQSLKDTREVDYIKG